MPLRLVKRGDIVVALAGKDRGRRGKVISILRRDGRVLVDGLNMVVKHARARGQRPTTQLQTGRITQPAPMPLAKVMVVCPHCDKPSRVRARIVENRRVRACRRCDEVVDAL